jgi:dipeptidyl aminopeptidase/acylaminoacyl peptidase
MVPPTHVPTSVVRARRWRPCCAAFVLLLPGLAAAQEAPQPAPVRQSAIDRSAAGAEPLTLRDVSRNSRWLGVGVSDVRWALDGSAVFFRWHEDPQSGQDPAGDPWFRTDGAGRTVTRVDDADVHRIPAAQPVWSRDGRRAVWTTGGRLYTWDARRSGDGVALLYSGAESASAASLSTDGRTAHVMLGDNLHAFGLDDGSVRQLTRVHRTTPDRRSPAARALADQQLELFDVLRDAERRRTDAADRARRLAAAPPQPIPVEQGVRVDNVRLSPDGRLVTFRTVRAATRAQTQYMDYVTPSGQAEARNARPKVGDPRDEHRLGIVRVDPRVAPDDIRPQWVTFPEADGRGVVYHGPYWSLEGDRAVVQILSQDHKDWWIAELDADAGRARVLVHHRDDAWIGGPGPVAGQLQPALLEWLPGGRIVFAAELTGWSHLHLVEPDGRVRALTDGEWEVRGARLNRERTQWIVAGGREHPSDDHLYLMPAAGGELARITEGEGRFDGVFSPDGRRLAVIHSVATELPDLWLRDVRPGAAPARITVSGSDHRQRHVLAQPEIVRFTGPDGGPLWAALFTPATPHPQRPAVVHVHGGGYRQFAHRGWSVYGWDYHVGFINWLVQQGYTVLDFDYRGSAGFGRDYRTDIYRDMGYSDVDGAVAAVDWLVREHGVDRTRVGIYGLSYGGFVPLMALFRHPGVFAGAVAHVAVTDWAHYNDGWTSRILNLPQDDPEAYRRSSPIYHAAGLADPLLITHGVIDDNVHVQDAMRLVQRLIELEKDFETMFYPVERHTFATESSRYDYHRRMAAFFERHLLRPGEARRTLPQ